VKARDAGDVRDLFEGQAFGEMGFDEPDRLLGRIHGMTGLPSKRDHHDRFARVAFDSPCSGLPFRQTETDSGCFFRLAENTSQAIAGNLNPIVHTDRAFNPTARSRLPIIKTTRAIGQHVREDDDASRYL